MNKKSVDVEVAKLFPSEKNRPQIVMVPKDILVRPGPRIIEGIEFLKNLELKK